MNAKARLIDSMARSLQSAGYHNSGLNQIVADSGAPKGSMYHYFPGGKVALAVAAIDHSAEGVALEIGAILGRGLPLRPTLEAVVDFFAAQMESSGFTKGCPVATTTLEEAATTPEIRTACARAYGGWQAAMAAYLASEGVSSPEAAAETLLMLLEGALLLARAQSSTEPLERLKPTLSRLLGTQ